MKKLIALAAAATCGAALAVESANIVGYNATAITGGRFYLCSTQFDTTGGTGAGMRICDLISGEIPYGSQIQILNADGATYAIYKYLLEVYDADKDDFVPGWGDGGEELATAKLAPGSAFWFKASGNCSVTISGQILADSSKTLNINGGQFSMIANPYPAPVNPNALTWTGLSYGDQMQVLNDDGATYSIYRYLEESYDATLDDFVPGWGDGGEEMVTTGIIPVGQGAWIKPKENLTVEWESPL